MFGFHSIPAASPPVLHAVYQYAKLAKPAKIDDPVPSFPSSPSEVLYRWHLPDPRACGAAGDDGCSSAKSRTVVVLLGWLGAKQKHLKRYAEWYTSRGFHAVTFTFPMTDIMSYKVGGKAEQNLDLLANHLADWVAEESGKNLVFHTFSNTGWLTYAPFAMMPILRLFIASQTLGQFVTELLGCLLAAMVPYSRSFASRRTLL